VNSFSFRGGGLNPIKKIGIIFFRGRDTMEWKGAVSNHTYDSEKVFVCNGEELKRNLIRMFKQTNRVQLTIIKGDYMIMSVPITLSIFLFRLYPFLSILTTAYLLKHSFSIKIQKILVT